MANEWTPLINSTIEIVDLATTEDLMKLVVAITEEIAKRENITPKPEV